MLGSARASSLAAREQAFNRCWIVSGNRHLGNEKSSSGRRLGISGRMIAGLFRQSNQLTTLLIAVNQRQDSIQAHSVNVAMLTEAGQGRAGQGIEAIELRPISHVGCSIGIGYGCEF